MRKKKNKKNKKKKKKKKKKNKRKKLGIIQKLTPLSLRRFQLNNLPVTIRHIEKFITF
jgi:hypothetical protein